MGSPVSFSECGIFFIWGSGFGILKQNRGGFGIESIHGRSDTTNNTEEPQKLKLPGLEPTPISLEFHPTFQSFLLG